MNKFSLLGIYLIICVGSMAQTVSVKGQRESVRGNTVEGYGTELEGKKDDVQSAWLKFLKDFGKVRQADPITINDPVINGLTFSKGVVYSVVHEKGDKTSIWLGIKPDEWETKDVDRINNELEKAVNRFGVKYYRDKIQVQIDDAQEAWGAVEKQKQRLINQNKELAISLSNNEQEKLQLDKSIEANKFENAVLLVKINNNKKAQDSLARAAEQIQKIKQSHIERQKKVN
jgi:hypothetical protein